MATVTKELSADCAAIMGISNYYKWSRREDSPKMYISYGETGSRKRYTMYSADNKETIKILSVLPLKRMID